jgi:hypothetical protein
VPVAARPPFGGRRRRELDVDLHTRKRTRSRRARHPPMRVLFRRDAITDADTVAVGWAGSFAHGAGSATRCGTARDLDRIRSLLRALGVRQGVRRSRQRAGSGWDALTETEVRIAGEVMKGHTNARIDGRSSSRLVPSRPTCGASSTARRLVAGPGRCRGGALRRVTENYAYRRMFQAARLPRVRKQNHIQEGCRDENAPRGIVHARLRAGLSAGVR